VGFCCSGEFLAAAAGKLRRLHGALQAEARRHASRQLKELRRWAITDWFFEPDCQTSLHAVSSSSHELSEIGREIWSVAYAIKMKPYNIYSLTVLMLKLFRTLFHMIFSIIPPTNMTNLFKNWLHEVNKKIKRKFGWELVFYDGLYRTHTMISFLTDPKNLPFLMLSCWLRTGFICGHVSIWMSCPRIWFLGATIWKR
jgi:hypothetical protein